MEHIHVADEKYTVVIHPNGGLEALRYGEKWRDLTGDKLVYCLAYELQEVRRDILFLREAYNKMQDVFTDMDWR